MGNLLMVTVHAANKHDTMSGIFPAMWAVEKYPSIRKISADGGYRGTFEEDVKSVLGIEVEISMRKDPAKWQLMAKRWIVERTLAWLNWSRRLSKDYEILICSERSMIKISHIYTLIKRL